MSLRSIQNQNKGFTLIEVILAISILATLSVLSTQALSRALKSRAKIQTEVDDVSALRDAMRLIKTDINLAFHHRDFEKEMLDLASKSNTPAATPGAQYNPATAAQNSQKRETKRYDPTTHFYGSDSEVQFVTSNNSRMSTAQKQADFIEVGYTLKDCSNLSTGKSSKCLYRRTQGILDEDVKTGGNEIVMLENVTEFKLRYIGETKQDWVSAWDSTNSSTDGGTKARFPEAVEVSLAIEREIEKKMRTYSMLYVISVHFPNNAPEKSNTSNAAPTGQTP